MREKKFAQKTTQFFIIFATWSETFLDLRQTFSNKIVRTAFYVSRETFCRKNLIHQFHVLREVFRDFWQETRISLRFFQICGEREREFDRNSLGFFFSFSAGFPNLTLALRRNISRKNTFQWKILLFTVFRR